MKKKKRLKIAMVIDVFDLPNGGGMISTRRFVEYLRKSHDVIVVSTGEPKPGKVVLPNFYVPFVRKIMKRMRVTFAWPKANVLKEVFSQVDIVHIQLPFLLGMKSLKVAKDLNVPVISSFHVQPENICYNIGLRSKFLIDTIYKFFIKKFYNKTEAVICPSRFAESELKRYGLKSPGYVISNGALPQFKPMKSRRDPKFKDKFVILSVGRLARDKRHDVLINAIALSKYTNKIQLIATGQGPMKDKLEEMGEILPNLPLFTFVSEEELIRFYNSADLFVHPSEVELESMAVLEALACGLPALISDSKTSAAKQFALSNKFLFKCNDTTDLASKIDYWIEHSDELLKAKKKCRELSKDYNIKESIKKLENIYYQYIRK